LNLQNVTLSRFSKPDWLPVEAYRRSISI